MPRVFNAAGGSGRLEASNFQFEIPTGAKILELAHPYFDRVDAEILLQDLAQIVLIDGRRGEEARCRLVALADLGGNPGTLGVVTGNAGRGRLATSQRPAAPARSTSSSGQRRARP